MSLGLLLPDGRPMAVPAPLRSLTLALAVVTAVAATTPALADDVAEAEADADAAEMSELDHEARLHYELGRRSFERGEFVGAAEEFEKALSLVDRPALHYNAYLAYREVPNHEMAIKHLQAYLPYAPERSQTLLRARLAGHKRELEQQRELAAEREARAQPEPSVTPAPSEQAADEPSAWRKRAPWLVMVGGGAMVLTGTGLGVAASMKESELDKACQGGCPPSSQSLMDQGQRLALASDVMWIGGVGVLTAGLVWLLMDKNSSDRSAALNAPVQAGCNGDGCAVAVRGSF